MGLQDALTSLQDGLSGIVGGVQTTLGKNSSAIIGGAAAAGVVAGAGLLIASAVKKRTTTKRKKITHTKRGWKQDRARVSKQKWEQAYQKRKRALARKKRTKSSRSKGRSRSTGLKWTKNGQPYKILASGKAKFVKKTAATMRRRRR